MIKKLFLIVILALPILPEFASAGSDVYFITQDGAGMHNGSSTSNAWSVADFNNAANWSSYDNTTKIDPGDTVYFLGDITSRVKPAGSGNSSSGYITLDGYKDGDCNPLSDACPSSAILHGGLWIDSRDYITVQDFTGTGGPTDLSFLAIYSSSSRPSNHIQILRNNIYNTNGNMFGVAGVSDPNRADNITITGNKMVGFGKKIDAAQGFNIYNASNIVIKNNIIGHEGTTVCTSANVIEVHQSQYILFDGNEIYGAPQQAGIFIKEYGAQDIIIRANNIHNNGTEWEGRGIGCGWASTQNIYIYNNSIYDNGAMGLDIADGAHNIFVWSNNISSHKRAGIVLWWVGGRAPGDPHLYNINIYNNFFTNNATSAVGYENISWTGLAITDWGASNISVKNNMFSTNRDRASLKYQIYVNPGLSGSVSLEHNQYFSMDQTSAIVYYLDNLYDLSALQSFGLEDDYPTGFISDQSGTTLSSQFSGSPGSVTIQGQTYVMSYSDSLNSTSASTSSSSPIAPNKPTGLRVIP